MGQHSSVRGPVALRTASVAPTERERAVAARIAALGQQLFAIDPRHHRAHANLAQVLMERQEHELEHAPARAPAARELAGEEGEEGGDPQAATSYLQSMSYLRDASGEHEAALELLREAAALRVSGAPRRRLTRPCWWRWPAC